MLTPVSFRKGKATEPRLSAPYVPGRHSAKFWREEEEALIREHYQAQGAAYCASRLPGRSVTSVYNRTRAMGLRCDWRAPRSAPIGTSLDDTIRDRWPFLAGKGAVSAFAAEIGLPRHTISARAMKLGLTMPHRKEPRWTEAEDELLRQAPVNSLEMASRIFAAHGFPRSPASINVRCKRIGLSRRLKGVLSATAAARILGSTTRRSRSGARTAW